MRNKVFIDSNIFLYSLTKPKDNNGIEKREISLNLLNSLIKSSKLIVSIQVLNEIYYNFVRKFKIIEELANLLKL